MTFTIEPGKTTTLAIKPVIYKDATFAVNFWMPTLMASLKGEAGNDAGTALNTRGASSIAWPQYNGLLKVRREVGATASPMKKAARRRPFSLRALSPCGTPAARPALRPARCRRW